MLKIVNCPKLFMFRNGRAPTDFADCTDKGTFLPAYFAEWLGACPFLNMLTPKCQTSPIWAAFQCEFALSWCLGCFRFEMKSQIYKLKHNSVLEKKNPMEWNTIETWLKRRTVYLQSSHNEYNDCQGAVAVKSTHSFVCVLQGESRHKSSYNQDEAQHLEWDMEIKPGRIP